jgi:site-specific DNA-methyltransferase (adenine-specific)
MFLDPEGGHVGYKSKHYRKELLAKYQYSDNIPDFWDFLLPRLRQAHRILKSTGTIYVHFDYRESHYAKLELDKIFGRENFLNEIIWAYDYGAKPKNKWPAKHDNILVYVKDTNRYYFDTREIEREPYMAPGLVSPEKAARGKLPTDVWWHTIVSPTGQEKTGYPTQKPLAILKRIIAASSQPGDLVLDFFAGSGTTGEAAWQLQRRFILVDQNPEAIEIMRKRFAEMPEPVEFRKL